MPSSITLHMIKELAIWVLLGAFLAGIWVVPLINFLYKLQFTVTHISMPSKANEEWMKIHGRDNGTPTNGGVLIWVTSSIVLLFGFWAIPLFRAIGFTILIVGLYGLSDKVLDTITRNNVEFREFQNRFEWRVAKLTLSLIINVIVALLIVYVAKITTVSVLGFTIALNTWYGVILLAIASSLFSYSTEIIDGIDALSSGMYLITFSGFALLMLAFPASFLVGQSLSSIVVIGLLIGILLVHLYFNIPPARVFMAEVGAMPMGPIFLILALYANMLPAVFVLIAPYALDLLSSLIQLLSLRFRKKKVFKIAPVHHHFEALGWSGPKVVMRAWLFNVFFVFLAVLLQIFLNS